MNDNNNFPKKNDNNNFPKKENGQKEVPGIKTPMPSEKNPMPTDRQNNNGNKPPMPSEKKSINNGCGCGSDGKCRTEDKKYNGNK